MFCFGFKLTFLTERPWWYFLKNESGTLPAVQWLRLGTFAAVSTGPTHGWGTRSPILHVCGPLQKINK